MTHRKLILAAVLLLAAPTTVLADAIDGNWCSADGQHMTINGDDITTPGDNPTVLVAMNFSRGLVELFTFIILLATLSALVPYTFCSLAGVILHRRERTMTWSTGALAAFSCSFIR